MFAYELPSGRRSFVCATPVGFCKRVRDNPTKAHWHECLNAPGGAGGCDPYIDIDIPQAAGLGHREAEEVLGAVVEGMEKVLGEWGGEVVVSVYSSCGGGKYSWHVVGRHNKAICRDTKIAWMVALGALEAAGGEVERWFWGGDGQSRQCFVDIGVYAHGFLRTVWSTKRNSKRMKVPLGGADGTVQEGGEVHLVGEPSCFGGAFWSEVDVRAMCKGIGFDFDVVLAKWGRLWKLETGQRLPRKKGKVVGIRVEGGAQSCVLGDGAAALCECLVGVLGPDFAPAGAATWAAAQARTRVLRFRTASRYCPFAHRPHSSNNVYVNVHVDTVPMTYKIFCTSSGCTNQVAAAGSSTVPLAVALSHYETKRSLPPDRENK